MKSGLQKHMHCSRQITRWCWFVISVIFGERQVSSFNKLRQRKVNLKSDLLYNWNCTECTPYAEKKEGGVFNIEKHSKAKV